MRELDNSLKINEEFSGEDREALAQGQQGDGVQLEQQQVAQSREHATNTASKAEQRAPRRQGGGEVGRRGGGEEGE